MVKNPPANAENSGSMPESGRCPGEGNGNPLQYSSLGNLMDRGGWWATIHGVTKSQIQLIDLAHLVDARACGLSNWRNRIHYLKRVG